MSPLTAFITGISTGGLTCMAVQGGLLLGLLAQRRAEDESARRWTAMIVPVAAFLAAKLFVYTVLGLGLGAIGARLQLSSAVSVWLQSIAGVFIIITGLRILWPNWLPWLAITPPASIRRFVRRQAKSDAWLAPAFLGLLTILIPCGTTIAMEASAVATGSAIKGASILFAFVLGTAPLFFLVGILAKGANVLQNKLAWATAAIVVVLGLYTLNGALVMVDSPYTFQNETKAIAWVLTGPGNADEGTAASNVTIEVRGTGYVPNAVTVPAGQPVTINLAAIGRLGCTSIFRIPKLNIEKTLTPDTTSPFTATFPSPGKYTFSCGMGMYTGTIDAI